MFTKTSIAIVVFVAVTSTAFAAQKKHSSHDSDFTARASALDAARGPITLPATRPEDNRHGWFMEW